MGVTQVVYEIDGWGTGELVVADGLVVWHDSPWPRARTSLVPSQTPSHLRGHIQTYEPQPTKSPVCATLWRAL